VCVDCGCDVDGTVGWSRDCHVVTGQCRCRPLVNSRRCDECVDGAYSLQRDNAFGCQRITTLFISPSLPLSVCLPLCLSVCVCVSSPSGVERRHSACMYMYVYARLS